MGVETTKRAIVAAIGALSLVTVSAQSHRALKPDDIFELKTVGDPRISPDGAWVAYTVAALDRKEDNSDTDIYMVPAAGGPADHDSPPARNPRRRPAGVPTDGTSPSSRPATAGSRRSICSIAAAATRVLLTDYKTGASSIAWSPDSSKLAVLVTDPDPKDTEARSRRRQEAEAARHHAPAVHARRRRLPE